MKEESISKFENSLKDYLISSQAGHYGEVKQYSYKYNNLKFYMNPERYSEAHFFVQIGISEACYSIEGGNKLDGGLGREDRLVMKWCGRYNIHRELITCWERIKQRYLDELEAAQEMADEEFDEEKDPLAEDGEEEDDDYFPEKEIYKMRDDDLEEGELEIDMTSTGISKRKRIIAQERKRRLVKFKKKDIKINNTDTNL